MSILHFVGEHISTSLLNARQEGKEIIRVAKESDPDQYMDFDPDEWNELFTVVEMIMMSQKVHRNMGSQLTIIPIDMEPPNEEGQP